MKNTVEIYNLEDLPLVLKAEKGVHKTYYFYHTGSIDKDEMEIRLSEEGGIIDLKGVIVGGNKDDINFSTITKHIKGDNNARVHIKAVLDDYCHFDFKGMIEISKNAQLADSYLQQDNLVISDNVVCNSTPQLEIGANDVKASHGVTVGSFDKNELFYMTSRGLNEEESKNLIAEGFLASVFGDDLERIMEKLNLKTLI